MRVVLFTRRGCHLCEQVEDLLGCLCPQAVIVDVDACPEDAARYGLRVPVLNVDGADVLDGKIDESSLVEVFRACQGRIGPFTGRTEGRGA